MFDIKLLNHEVIHDRSERSEKSLSSSTTSSLFIFLSCARSEILMVLKACEYMAPDQTVPARLLIKPLLIALLLPVKSLTLKSTKALSVAALQSVKRHEMEKLWARHPERVSFQLIP